MSETFYITTPIYYVNSHPHIGHAYTTIVTDVFVRYRKLFGEETYFLTGTDEHGQKIAESAQAANLKPQEFVDRMTAEFRDMWPHLHIQQDHFIRTTDAFHKSAVQAVLQKIYDQGEIYGLQHDPGRFTHRSLRPETPIKGFYLTGQDIATAGVGGAMIGGVLCASAILKQNLMTEVMTS